MTTIIVRTLDGTNVRYDNILPGITVAQFKQRIAEKQGIAVRDQRLLYSGKYLEDEHTLDSYTISDNFVVRLVTVVPTPNASVASNIGTLFKAPILRAVFIKPASGPTVRISDVPADTTIERMKQMYFYKTNQEPDGVRLLFGGKELEEVHNGKVMNLMDYGVGNDSTLHEVFRVHGGELLAGVESHGAGS